MERCWDPHRCGGCGIRFEVGYDGELDAAAATAAEVSCPGCGKVMSVPVPDGAEGDLVVELAGDEDADEGAGG